MSQNPFLWWLPSSGGTSTDTPAEARPARAPKKPRSAATDTPVATTEGAIALPGVYDKAGHLIRRAQQIAVAIFLEECAAFDLTPVQYAVLAALRDNPGSDATRIGGLVAFDRTTISGVMERLEAKGFLARKASDEDKRIKTLTLTAEGKKLLRKVGPAVDRAQERILSPLAAEEQATLLALLGKLVQLNNDASRRLPEAD